MKKINSKKRNAYGSMKPAIADCLEKNMTAKEIAELLGTSRHTIYSVAGRLNMKPKYVYNLTKKFPHGELTKLVTKFHNDNMTAKEISEKLKYNIETIYGIIKKKIVKPVESLV
jgi:DNA-binding CsgD family transcriptional regulator